MDLPPMAHIPEAGINQRCVECTATQVANSPGKGCTSPWEGEPLFAKVYPRDGKSYITDLDTILSSGLTVFTRRKHHCPQSCDRGWWVLSHCVTIHDVDVVEDPTCIVLIV